MNNDAGHATMWAGICMILGGIIVLGIGIHANMSLLHQQLTQVQHQIHQLQVLLKAKR